MDSAIAKPMKVLQRQSQFNFTSQSKDRSCIKIKILVIQRSNIFQKKKEAVKKLKVN